MKMGQHNDLVLAKLVLPKALGSVDHRSQKWSISSVLGAQAELGLTEPKPVMWKATAQTFY